MTNRKRESIGKKPVNEFMQLYIKRYKGTQYLGSKSIAIYGMDMDAVFNICVSALREKVQS